MRTSPIGSYIVQIIDDQGRIFSSVLNYDRPLGGMFAVDQHVGQLAREGVVLLEKRRKDDPGGKLIQLHERLLRAVVQAVDIAVVQSMSAEENDADDDAVA